jgi:MFS family permease
LTANSTAIITDAFPPDRRGFALGVNQVAGIGGSFVGLIVGGLLAEWHWRSVFWVSVPVGIWGTWMGYKTLRDKPRDSRTKVAIDWWGNLTFGVGLISILIAITYGLQAYGGHTMGWTSPKVLAGLIGGVVLLVAFVFIELRISDPMMDMKLFKIRAFAAGQVVNLLASMARGGLQFMLIIWLQGIWLPLHGYNFADTPLWAGIYMLPLTIGFLIAGPASGALSDRLGARTFATGGLLLVAATFAGLIAIPADFNYVVFAILLALNGIGMGLMAAPNSAAIMNAVPANERGAASGIRATGMNAGMVLSMGGFFTLMAVGLASRLPESMYNGLTKLGITPDAATQISHTTPVGTLFAAFLGDNPIKALVQQADPQALQPGSGVDVSTLTGKTFFPHLIADPFRHGLAIAFGASIVMLLIAAVASQMRGTRFVHADALGADATVPAGSDSAPPVSAASDSGQPVSAASDSPQPEGMGVALAREAAALDGIPQQDVEFEKALPDGESVLVDHAGDDELLPNDPRTTEAAGTGYRSQR